MSTYLTRNLRLARVQGAFFPLLTMLGGLSAVVILYAGGHLVIQGSVTVGEFVAFGVYLAMLVWPMIALGWAFNLVQRGAASMARINQLFAERPAITSAIAPVDLPPATRARTVEFRNVWFSYPGARDRGWVLQDISFRVERGASLAIVGPTGSGKSTLVDLIARTYDPDRGAVLIDGVDVRQLSLPDLRRAVGFVPRRRSCLERLSAATFFSGRRTMEGWSGFPRWPSLPRHYRSCRTATRPCWANGASTCPGGRSNARRLPGPWRRSRRFSSWMMR